MNPVRTPSARATRSAGLAVLASFALLALTGCLSIQADLAISPDAKGSGTFSILLQKQAAKLMGMTDLSTFSSGISEQDAAASSSGILSSGKCEATEDDENFIYTCTFSDAEFAKEGELWTIKKDGSKIVFQMKNAGSTGTDTATEGGDAGEMADLLGGSSLGELTVDVTFPGPIQEITGAGATKTSDTEASIKGAMTDTIDVTITSASSSSAPIGLIIGAVVGLLILAAIIIGLVLFFVRRGKKADVPADAPVEGAPITSEVAAGESAAATEAIEPARPIPMPGPETPSETVVAETVVAETVVAEPVVAEPVVADDAGPEENPPVS